MIKKIIKALKDNSEVKDYIITEYKTISHEAFYVLGKLETTRMVNATETKVTLYKQNDEFLGDASFTISHNVSKKELDDLISNTLFSATFVHNKPFALVSGTKKRQSKNNNSYDITKEINSIANIFHSKSTGNAKFNALEIFFKEITTTIVNSNGVNYTKTLPEVFVEAIPSYDGKSREENVEIYRKYSYKDINYELIASDAEKAIEDVTYRFFASKIPDIKKCDVILSENEVFEFFNTLIEYYSYSSVYKKLTDKKIGYFIQDENSKTLISLSLSPESKQDLFDFEGTILKQNDILKDGKLVGYYGGKQYADYLDIPCKGLASKIIVRKGKTNYDSMTNKPYIRIIALSGIQIESLSDYIGGEVRLALYFDGKKTYPVSGFSFSGSFKECLKTLKLSKEMQDIKGYSGPKYMKLHNLDIL